MKYGNRKTEIDGILFDSKKEASRYLDLKLMQQAGEISDLRMQVKYELVPPQKGETRNERAISYIADFVYGEKGKPVVEDVKGHRTKEYIIKRKLMKWVHGIEVKEI